MSWEGPAYDELHKRQQAINKEEAQILGTDSFAMVAGVREENLKREKAELEEAMIQVRREAEERVKEMADLVASYWESRESLDHAGRVNWERDIRATWTNIHKALRYQKWPGLREGLPAAVVVLVMSFVCYVLF